MFKEYKREIILAAVVFIVCVLLCGCVAKVVGGTIIKSESNTYALTTCVVEVDRDNDIVTCEDSNGNLWEFYGCEDWQEGDCASLLMNDQGTPNIYDDAIEGARYNAWTLTR